MAFIKHTSTGTHERTHVCTHTHTHTHTNTHTHTLTSTYLIVLQSFAPKTGVTLSNLEDSQHDKQYMYAVGTPTTAASLHTARHSCVNRKTLSMTNNTCTQWGSKPQLQVCTEQNTLVSIKIYSQPKRPDVFVISTTYV